MCFRRARAALVEAAHPDIADAVTVHGVSLHPICQEELCNPGRDMSINPNENSILTRLSPVPDVVLEYASTGQSRSGGAVTEKV